MNRLAILMIAPAGAAPATQTGQKSVEHVRVGNAASRPSAN